MDTLQKKKESQRSEDKRFGPAIKDFEFTVPADYKHDSQIDVFARKTKNLSTTYFNDSLTSSNFAKATTRLVPGKTYRVKIFPILSRVTSDDCMSFLRKQNAIILVGGQGVTLLQDSNPDEFPVGKYTVSFDEKDALWIDSDGDHRVPYVNRYSDGDWEFSLGYFEYDWDVDFCLLCFCDLQSSGA